MLPSSPLFLSRPKIVLLKEVILALAEHMFPHFSKFPRIFKIGAGETFDGPLHIWKIKKIFPTPKTKVIAHVHYYINKFMGHF